MSSGCSLLAHSGVRTAKPIMDVTSVREQMHCFAQIGRRTHGGIELRARSVELASSEGIATEGQVSADMLSQRAAFAALPGLKFTAGDELTGFVVLSGLVVEGTKFDAEIVALADEAETFCQFAQAFFWSFTDTFPKLVALVEKARV